jgi:hypothetical protein
MTAYGSLDPINKKFNLNHHHHHHHHHQSSSLSSSSSSSLLLHRHHRHQHHHHHCCIIVVVVVIFIIIIIRRAQQMHFDRMASSMSDEGAKQAFDKFLKQNQAGGSITERSKIVRTINRMDDPGKFFKAAGPEIDVTIGGRKGKTVLIGDQQGHTQRVRPNE